MSTVTVVDGCLVRNPVPLCWIFTCSYSSSIDTFVDEEEIRYLLPLKEYVGFCDSLKYVRRGERGRGGGRGVIDVSYMRKGEEVGDQGREGGLEGGICTLLCEF